MRRVHRLTPLLRLWTLVVALLAVAIVNLNASALASLGTFLRGNGNFLPLVSGVLAFAALCLAIWFLSYFWWRASGYELGEEEISLRRGVFSTQLRSARYERIQAVDVVEPLIARIFRLAAVRIETAGGSQSSIEIAYLERDRAEELRQELLAHVPHQAPAKESDELRVPLARALAGTALQWSTLIGTIAIVLLLLSPLPGATVLPIVVGIVPSIWKQIDSSWRFTATYDAAQQVLHVGYGLADRRRQAIPARRIHAVRAHQPMLWRPLGWWRVSATVVGYGVESSSSGTTDVLPVGTRAQAMAILAAVTDLNEAELEAVAKPEGHSDPDYTSPRRAWLVSPLDWRRQSVTLHNGVAICHRGLISRSVALIHTSHIQELTLQRGPFHNALNLASVRFDLVPGPVRMAAEDLELGDAYELLRLLRARRLPAFA